MSGVFALRISRIPAKPPISVLGGPSVLAYDSTCLAQTRLHVYSADHVRGHVFLCMLAYYVEWHMRQRLAPLLFQDDDPAAARAQRDTPVAAAQVSERARGKARSKRTAEGFPAHSFPTLLGDLASLVLNRVRLPTPEQAAITIATKPTRLQRRAFDLLGIDPKQDVSITVTR